MMEHQQKVLDTGIADSGFSWIFQAPTGWGKTHLARKIIKNTNGRAVYLSPLRALAAETQEAFREEFGEVGLFTGDQKPPYPVSFAEARVLVMTPEKLDACIRAWRTHWHWLPEVSVVIVDEVHLLADPHRGPRLEGTISRLKRLNPFVRFVGLSATIGNPQSLADWLDGVSYVDTYRPVPLHWRYVKFRKAEQKPDLLVDEVQSCIDDNGRSIVFVQSRRRAEVLAAHLIANGINADFHHAGLSQGKRACAETAFRDKQLDAIVATPTLEMGLNLGARQVILYDAQRFNGIGYEPLTVNTVWQRGGRAGRPGQDDAGEVVLFVPSWDRVPAYENGRFEPILSGLPNEHALTEQIITEVACGLCRTTEQITDTFQYSYLAGQQGRVGNVVANVQAMLDAGMLTEKKREGKTPQLKATWLGYTAVRHFLLPATVITIRSAFKGHPELTFFDLLLLAASNDDAQPMLHVDFEELDALTADINDHPSSLLHLNPSDLFVLLGVSGRRLLSALKTAVVMRTWTQTGDAESVAERFGCYAFEVNRLRESLQRILMAMQALLSKEEDEQ